VADLGAIITALKTQAATIAEAGSRVFDYIPDQVGPPAIVIAPAPNEGVGQHNAILNGVCWWYIDLTVVVSRVSDRAGQARLWSYMSSTGTKSVKAVIEASPTLGGLAHVVLIDAPDEWGEVTFADVPYWGATWRIRVLA
jgi:hypothetical protein